MSNPMWTSLDAAKIPHRILNGLREYIEERQPVGPFLKAVLSNDLRQAIMFAENIEIANIVQFLHWQAPADCWGSYEKVDGWLAKERGVQCMGLG